jgi:hypothetical protein
MTTDARPGTLAAFAEALQRAMSDFAEEWPPERIVASAIAEHNRRMDEFNGRAPHREAS